MFNNISSYAPTKRSAIRTIYTAFQILKENGNEMQRKELIAELERRLVFEEWEIQRYKSNNQLKWLTVFLFYSIDSMKAGWLAKNKGVWYLTPKGSVAMENGPEWLFEEASKAYRKWSAERPDEGSREPTVDDVDIADQQVQNVTLDELQAQAFQSISDYLQKRDEYEFQDMCAALLRVMKYHVDFVAPPGRDGGIDLIAFADPLGYSKPKIKVQVKRYKPEIKIGPDAIRSLRGLLHQGEDIGVFITTSDFTNDAKRFARESNTHIKLINGEQFIELWIQHYHLFTEVEKDMLPLQPIYHLGKLE